MTDIDKQGSSAATRGWPWGRLVLTLLAPVVVLLGQRVALPGVDETVFSDPPASVPNVSVMALGVTPLIAATILVELFALAVPAWRPLRHGGPQGRRNLGRAAAVLGLVLAALQGFTIARLLASLPNRVDVSTLQVIATLVAATACLSMLIELVSARGLASGYGVIIVVLPIVATIQAVASRWGELTPGQIVVALAAVAVVAGATWYVLERRPALGAGKPRERAVLVPSPASGVEPYTLAISIVALPSTLAGLGLVSDSLTSALANPVVNVLIALAVMLVSGAFLSRIYNLPTRVGAVFARARGEGASRASLEAEARAEAWPATVRTLVFLVLLFAVASLAHRLSPIRFTVPSVAIAVALVLDVAAEWRAFRATPNLVTVWPEHRPYAVAAAREALEAEGIPLHARGERLRRLLQFFGPYVPIDLMVRREDAARAGEILDRVLRFTPEDARAADEDPRPAVRAKPSRAEASVLLLLALLVGGSVAANAVPRSERSPRTSAPAVSLEFVGVDDDRELLDGDTARQLSSSQDTPRGVSFELENAPVGPGKNKANHFVRIMRLGNERMADAAERLRAWLATIRPPEGDRVALEEVREFDDEKGVSEPIGWRTYLIRGAPEFTAADVAEAYASQDPNATPPAWRVLVKLTPAGAKRFADYTGANLKRRLAIVIDGRVESAPVITAPITGGTVAITMGSGNLEEQKAAANRLAAALGGS